MMQLNEPNSEWASGLRFNTFLTARDSSATLAPQVRGMWPIGVWCRAAGGHATTPRSPRHEVPTVALDDVPRQMMSRTLGMEPATYANA